MTYDVYRVWNDKTTMQSSWIGNITADSVLEAHEAADRLFGDSDEAKLVVVPEDSGEGVSKR